MREGNKVVVVGGNPLVIGVVVSVEPYEDAELGLSSSLDEVLVKWEEDDYESFFATDLRVVGS